jgi:hypothetical protein
VQEKLSQLREQLAGLLKPPESKNEQLGITDLSAAEATVDDAGHGTICTLID